MKRIVFLTAALAAVCISSAAGANEIQKAAGSVRQVVAENITQPEAEPTSQRAPGASTGGGGPAAWPHHQPTTRWSRHHRNTTTPRIAKPANASSIPTKRGFYHQVTSRWARHYRNTSSPSPK
jgi:hypothetical protein